jgi:hypothetical protein
MSFSPLAQAFLLSLGALLLRTLKDRRVADNGDSARCGDATWRDRPARRAAWPRAVRA